MRSISIAESGNDSLSVYENSANFVGIFNYEDSDKLKTLKLADKSGIYILIGERERYVGQAVGQSLRTRISQHSENWITKVIFFGRKNDEFSKDQADYLEANLIKYYKDNSNFKVTNKTNGNTSPISLNAELSAKELSDSFFDVLENVANIDLLHDDDEKDDISDGELYIKFLGQEVRDYSPRHVQIKFVQKLLGDKDYGEKLRQHVVDDKATFKNNLGRKQNIFPSGQVAAKEVEPGIFLWVNSSRNQTAGSVDKIAAWLDLKIDKNF